MQAPEQRRPEESHQLHHPRNLLSVPPINLSSPRERNHSSTALVSSKSPSTGSSSLPYPPRLIDPKEPSSALKGVSVSVSARSSVANIQRRRQVHNSLCGFGFLVWHCRPSSLESVGDGGRVHDNCFPRIQQLMTAIAEIHLTPCLAIPLLLESLPSSSCDSGPGTCELILFFQQPPRGSC
jgi:hypothetical protein